MKKKVDARIRTLVENCVKQRQRSVFVIVGDRGRDQVVNLHYLLSKATVKARPSVLWCYKKDLYLSSHRRKRAKQVKKLVQRGLLDPEKEDPFSLFVASTNIRYCYYNETHTVLGQTFGMCVLQDFEALTPNLLARTVETVEGGGIVVLLLNTMDSLTRLYTMAMDVHARFRTESHQQVTGRFNERFILSLVNCANCIFMDDELNILPLSTHVRSLEPLPSGREADPDGAGGAELRDLRSTLADTPPAGPLLQCCASLDQAKAVVTFMDAISEKTLRSTVALTAARGRGKSAALGLAIAGALAAGYANIFVTSPSPENLRTLFEFVFKGLDALGYKEHLDYDLVESTHPDFKKAIVRVNVYRSHRQTVQYVQPQHAERVSQAELLIIDEAAAIPLPVVRQLLGPYLVFLCSTVNGYEGTGRSLSLKLIQQLRQQGAKMSSAEVAAAAAPASGDAIATAAPSVSSRTFKEVVLSEPIRYAAGDRVERWLNDLLCLDAAEHVSRLGASSRLPHPQECELYCVNRDTLFSGHRDSESFLQRIMGLYVASHYRNTPNDLQMLSDAPAHRLFVLLPPVDETTHALPDVLCVVQVALEGAISRQSAAAQLAAGTAPQGDLIPWTVSQQFQDDAFPGLTGARCVRVAIHPELSRMGYGTRAMALLERFYAGALAPLGERPADTLVEEESAPCVNASDHAGDLMTETLRPRKGLPPLLTPISERVPERVQWLGAAFGLTQELFNFWFKLGYQPVYLRQTPSDVTGECSCVMLRAVGGDDAADGDAGGDATTSWVHSFGADFRVRYASLLGSAFRSHAPGLALSLLAAKLSFSDQESAAGVSPGSVPKADGKALSPHDMKRLASYAAALADHHLIRDLIPPLARAYFGGAVPATLSYAQAAILVVLGLQQRELSDAEHDLGLPSSQILALFNKAMRRLHACLNAAEEARAKASLPQPSEKAVHAAQRLAAAGPHPVALDDALREGATKVLKQQQDALLRSLNVDQYAIRGDDADWDAALGGAPEGAAPRTGVLSVRRKHAYKPGNGGVTPSRVAGEQDGDRQRSKKGKRERVADEE